MTKARLVNQTTALPPVSPLPRTARAEPMTPISMRAMAVVRVGVGLMWVSNLNWKMPPNFGSDTGHSLYGYTHAAVTHPVFGPYSWVIQHGVLPHFHTFAWGVIIIEAALGAFLILGLGTRLWGAIGTLQALAIGLSAAFAPGEWPWSYWLMIMANLTLFATGAGRAWGFDAIIRPLFADRSGRAGRLVRAAT